MNTPAQNNDEVRAQFEAWALGRFLLSIERDSGVYVDTYTFCSWLAYQAALQSPAVRELVEAAKLCSGTLGHAYHTTLTGELAEDAHTAYQRLDVALRALGA